MKVSDFKKRTRRTTEAAFEKAFADALQEQDIWSRHMADRNSGLPDRYLGQGRWVELKSLEYAKGLVPYGAGLSVEQRNVGTDLIVAGDEVWYLALITATDGQHVLFMPMHKAIAHPERFVDCKADENTLGSNVFRRSYRGKDTLRELIPLSRW
jgi:hypothetical protein